MEIHWFDPGVNETSLKIHHRSTWARRRV